MAGEKFRKNAYQILYIHFVVSIKKGNQPNQNVSPREAKVKIKSKFGADLTTPDLMSKDEQRFASEFGA